MATDDLLIAADHAGFELKEAVKALLPDLRWKDLGTASAQSVDYPDFAQKLGKEIQDGRARLGILICGSGIGMSIAANKLKGIRAALVENPVAARLSREHNDANVLCLASRFIAPQYAAEIIQIWIDTGFSNEARHLGRINKMKALEGK